MPNRVTLEGKEPLKTSNQAMHACKGRPKTANQVKPVRKG
jgi:hypothetical protein